MTSYSILLVDDDVSLTRSFKKILENAGFSVTDAATGREALETIEEKKFELIILDIVLPDFRGDLLAKKIRSRDNYVKIILITGYPSFQDCIDLLDTGIYDILLKPIEPDELLNIIGEALSVESNYQYWLGKDPDSRKAVTEYKILSEKGYNVTQQEISKKYAWSPAIATISRHFAKLRKRKKEI